MGASFSSDTGNATESANFPHLAIAAGNVYIAWEQFPDCDRRPQGIVSTWSPDGGDNFLEFYALPGSEQHNGINGGMQWLLMDKLAANSAGDKVAVHSRFLPDIASHVWLYRGQVQ